MRLLILFLITLFPIVSFSQNVIITQSGDTLRGKITKVDDSKYYLLKKNRWGLYKKDEVSFTDVKYVNFDKELVAKERNPYEFRSHFTTTVDVGYSVKPNLPKGILNEDLFISEKDEARAKKRLRHGVLFNADVNYYFLPHFALGVKYNFFNSNVTITNPLYDTKVSQYNGFVGPGVSYRLRGHNRDWIVFDVHPGWININEKVKYLYSDVVTNPEDHDYNLKEHTFGADLGVNYDLYITQKLGMSFHFSYLAAKKYTKIAPKNNSYEDNPSRFNFSVGFRYGG